MELDEWVVKARKKMLEDLAESASTLSCWIAMMDADAELDGIDPVEDDVMVLNYMGHGSSVMVTMGDLREIVKKIAEVAKVG